MTTHNLVTVGNVTPVRLTPNGLHSGMDITLQNVSSSGYIYVGAEGVSDEDYGYRLLPNHAISFELRPVDALYALASAPDTKLAVLQISLESQN